MVAHGPVSHVIFDLDGLLLDTEILYTDVAGQICKEYGKKYTWEIKVQQMGKKEIVAAQLLIDILDLPLTPEEYMEKSHCLFKEKFPDAALLPGVEKLLRHLHKHNIPMAVATGSNKQSYDLKTARHQQLFEVFQHVVLSGDDPEVKVGKPAPDCFLVAARRFKNQPSPEKVLVFEDAPNGLLAAHSAGMQCVWIPDACADQKNLKGKATLILKSLEEFQPEQFGLPPFDC